MEGCEESVTGTSRPPTLALQRSGGFERGSMTSAVSTESGIHMGSEHDNAGPGTPEHMTQSHRLTSIIKNVKRSHSYNVSDVNNSLKHRPVVRPKSLVSGWEQSSISTDEILMWQAQLKQLQQFNNSNMNLVTKKAKVPKKESLREKARTLINQFREKRKTKGSVSSCESRGTEEDPDSQNSSYNQSTPSIKKRSNSCINSSWDSCKDSSWSSSDVLRILKVFPGGGLRSSHNAEYRSVLATVDTSVLEVKKQSISKYGFEDENPHNYVVVCVTGSYLDNEGKTITTSSADFGSKSEVWRELHSELLNDNTKPLSIRGLLEDEECSRLEIRPVNEPAVKLQMDNVQKSINGTVRSPCRSGGLHHFPVGCPFLLLIHGYDRIKDNIIYPIQEGITQFKSSSTPSNPATSHNTILLHTNDNIDLHLTRTGTKCTLVIVGHQERNLKSGECFLVGKHYQFMYKDACDRVFSPVMGSPDTQRTLSTGTLTSLVSPDLYLNPISSVIHQHAEPRFVFYMEHKDEVFDAILNYNILMHKYPLACGLLTIMCLRHCYDSFGEQDTKQVLICYKERTEVLAKVAQQRAVLILNNKSTERVSPTSFLKPMTRLLANTLEILHFMKEFQPGHKDIARDVEKLSVSMFEYVAYHTAKMVYELLPSVLENPDEDIVSGNEQEPKSPTTASDNDLFNNDPDRRWSMPLCAANNTSRKRKMKIRPRNASLGTLDEDTLFSNKSKSCTNINDCEETPVCNGTSSSSSHSSSVSEHNLCHTRSDPTAHCRRRSSGRPDLSSVSPGMKHLVQLLQKFHNLGSTCSLNNTMIKQLFTSLFFFSNTTLFNTLVECTCPKMYYNWKRGTQMRINMNFLLKWAQQYNLAVVADKHFSELNAVLDLLSIPKKVLMTSNWTGLLRAFPALKPHQLNHFLSIYCTDRRPKTWSPSPPIAWSTADPLSAGDIKLELSAYPQLVIPNRCYKLSCSYEIPDSIRSLLCKITKSLTTPKLQQLGTTLKSCSDDIFTSEQIIRCTIQKTSKSIGLRLKKSDDGAIMINDIVYSSPAQICGKIELQDGLVAINDVHVGGTSVNYCKKLILESGDKLALTLSRVTIS